LQAAAQYGYDSSRESRDLQEDAAFAEMQKHFKQSIKTRAKTLVTGHYDLAVEVVSTGIREDVVLKGYVYMAQVTMDDGHSLNIIQDSAPLHAVDSNGQDRGTAGTFEPVEVLA
jgi:hypothetical protein